MVPDIDCYPMLLAYYTATGRLFKTEDRGENKKTWFFYDESGQKITEYNVANGGVAWLSTRDYIYRGSSLLAIVDTLKNAAAPKIYHLHLGIGIKGIQTDVNGFKAELVD